MANDSDGAVGVDVVSQCLVMCFGGVARNGGLEGGRGWDVFTWIQNIKM